jgi:hypothetical protein
MDVHPRLLMGGQTQIELEFGDGSYVFALKLPQILELQRSCGHTDARGVAHPSGIFAIYGRVLKGRYVVQGSDVAFGVPHECEALLNDILETIRLGLVGGGEGLVSGQEVKVNALRARQLIETYCFPAAPLTDAWDIAAAILSAAIEGYEPQKKSPSATASQAKRQKASTKERS